MAETDGKPHYLGHRQRLRARFMADGGEVRELLTRWDAEKMMIGVHREGDDIKRLAAVNYTNIATLRPLGGVPAIVRRGPRAALASAVTWHLQHHSTPVLPNMPLRACPCQASTITVHPFLRSRCP